MVCGVVRVTHTVTTHRCGACLLTDRPIDTTQTSSLSLCFLHSFLPCLRPDPYILIACGHEDVVSSFFGGTIEQLHVMYLLRIYSLCVC
mmetsp:Transcript_27037/g.77744  ORF Transcript_27037/g.77744 Transcript_27037/m.77744 type:complete len:89 (-) Transcript_27037:540-806(-)